MFKQIGTALILVLLVLNVAQAVDAADLIYVADHDIVDNAHEHDAFASHSENDDAALHCIHCHVGHLRLSSNQSSIISFSVNNLHFITKDSDRYRSPLYAIDHPPC